MKKQIVLLIALGVPSAMNALAIRYTEGPVWLKEIKYHLYPSREAVIEKHPMHKRLHQKTIGEFTIHRGKTNCHPLEGETFVYLAVSWPEVIKEDKPENLPDQLYVHPLNSSALYEINIDNSFNATLKEIDANGGYPSCMPKKNNIKEALRKKE